jgi:hypothetical protein
LLVTGGAIAAACNGSSNGDDGAGSGGGAGQAASGSDGGPAPEGGPDTSCVVSRVVRTSSSAPASVGMYFTVEDCQGRPVNDLTCASYPGDCAFAVSEDDAVPSSQEEATVIPVKGLTPFVALLIETSTATQSRLPKVVAAAKSLVHKLQDGNNPLLTQIGIYAFAGDKTVTELLPPTLDQQRVLARLDTVADFHPMDPSSTNLYGAVIETLGKLGVARDAFSGRNSGGLTAGYLVVFAEGNDTAGLVKLEDVKICTDREARQNAPTQCAPGGSALTSTANVDGAACYPLPTCADGTCCGGGTRGTVCAYSATNGHSVCVAQNNKLCDDGRLVFGCPVEAQCSSEKGCCCTTEACSQALIRDRCGADFADVVGVAGMPGGGDLSSISGRYSFDATDEVALEAGFTALTSRITGQAARAYYAAMCSAKRAGDHTFSVSVATAGTNQTTADTSFNADGFGPGCSVAPLATACDQHECGGYGCGVCDDRVAGCDGTRCKSHCLTQKLGGSEPMPACGGQMIVNPQGYTQTCEDVPESTLCNGACVDTKTWQTDTANCGACGASCAGGTCAGGKCTCPSGQMQCAAGCTDVTKDVNNCGQCNMMCKGGGPDDVAVCFEKTCHLTTTLATGLSVGSFAIDATNAYWTSGDAMPNPNGAVHKVPLAGGSPEVVLVSGQNNSFQVAVDAKYVYWMNYNYDRSGSSVMQIPIAGVDPQFGFATPLATGQPYTTMAGSDGANVYYGVKNAAGTAMDIRSVSVAGGSWVPVKSTSAPYLDVQLQLVGSKLYWIEGGWIVGMPKTGGATEQIVQVGSTTRSFAVDDTNVSWLVENGTDRDVMTAPLAGGPCTVPCARAVMLAPAQPFGWSLNVLGNYIYWSTIDDTGAAIHRAPRTGGPSSFVVSHQKSIQTFAVDATNVYWVEVDKLRKMSL